MAIKPQHLIKTSFSFSYRLSLAFLFLSFTYLVTNSPIPNPMFRGGLDVVQTAATLGKGADDIASGAVDVGKMADNLGAVRGTPGVEDAANLKNMETVTDASKLKGLRQTELGDPAKFPDPDVKMTTKLPGTVEETGKVLDDIDFDTVKLADDAAKHSKGYITLGILKIGRTNPGLQTTVEKMYMMPRKIKMALNALKIEREGKKAMVLQMAGDGPEALRQLNRAESVVQKNRVLRVKWADKISKPYNIKHESRFRWYKYIKFFGKRGKQYDDIIAGKADPARIRQVADQINAKNVVKDANTAKLLKAKEARRVRIKNYKDSHPGMVKFYSRISRQWNGLKNKLNFAKNYKVARVVEEPPTNPSTAANIGEQTKDVGSRTGSDLAHSVQVAPGVTTTPIAVTQ